MNKIESKIISAILFGFIPILAVLASFLYPGHKKTRVRFSSNINAVSRFAFLFLNPLKVRYFVLAMNLIVFYKPSGWRESIVFLRARNPDFWLNHIQR